MIRRILAVIPILICIAATAAVWVFFRAGRQGEGRVERWIASQIIERAQRQLNPTLSFTELDYQYPTTVVMRDLKLTADDPRVPGSKLDVLAAGEAVMTLAEPPRVNRPIVVDRISFYRPAVRLVQVDGLDGRRGFAGFSNLVKRNRDISTTQPTTRVTRERIEEVLSINRVELIDGRIEYDPRIDDTPPMVLDEITALLVIQPTAEGQYRIQTNLGRKPIAESSVKSLIDLDALRLSDLEVTLTADLESSKADFLPPELQQLLRKYSAQGKLQVTATGDLSLADPSMSKLSMTMTLAEANLALKEYRFPLEQLNCSVRLGDGRLEIEHIRLRALNGELFVEGGIQLTPERDARLAMTARNIDLRELIDSNARTNTSLSGTLNGGVMLEVPIRVLRAKMNEDNGTPSATRFADEPWPPRWGTGTLEISDGYLVALPVLSQINTVVSTTLNLGRPSARKEQLKLQFEMNENKVNFSEMTYIGSAIAGRGKGHIKLDQTIDIYLNGGPVEKVQGLLGKTVGGILGKVTDSLASYHVSGTIKEPKVSLEVAPGLFGGFKPGHTPPRSDQ